MYMYNNSTYMYVELLCVEGEPGNKAMLGRVVAWDTLYMYMYMYNVYTYSTCTCIHVGAGDCLLGHFWLPVVLMHYINCQL